MTDEELLRYSRHILLDEIGVEGQERIMGSRALIIGAGGLGSPVALFLGSAGVGHLTIVDNDTVDMTNLQRQIAHSMSRVGQPKVTSAADRHRLAEPHHHGRAQLLPVPTPRCLINWLRRLMSCWTVATTSPRGTASMPPVSNTANRWFRARPFVLMVKFACTTRVTRPPLAMPVCSHLTRD